MNLPGTSPPNVQKRYSTPSASLRVTSLTSSSTLTLVAWFRLRGGGTLGAKVSTAVSSPCTDESVGLAFKSLPWGNAVPFHNATPATVATNHFNCQFVVIVRFSILMSGHFATTPASG